METWAGQFLTESLGGALLSSHAHTFAQDLWVGLSGDDTTDQRMHRPGEFGSIGQRLLASDLIAVQVLNRVTGKVGLWTMEQFEDKLERMRVEANPNAHAVHRVRQMTLAS